MCFGVWEHLLCHPFDDSRGLHDPNTKERGLQRPLDVCPIASFDRITTPNVLYIALKLCLKGFCSKTYCGIHLMIQEVCMTLLPPLKRFSKYNCGITALIHLGNSSISKSLTDDGELPEELRPLERFVCMAYCTT